MASNFQTCRIDRHLDARTITQSSFVMLMHPPSAYRTIVSSRLFQEARNLKDCLVYIGTSSVTFFYVHHNDWHFLWWNRNTEVLSHLLFSKISNHFCLGLAYTDHIATITKFRQSSFLPKVLALSHWRANSITRFFSYDQPL